MNITREQVEFIKTLTPEALEAHVALTEKRESVARMVSQNAYLLNNKIVSGEADENLDNIQVRLTEIMGYFAQPEQPAPVEAPVEEPVPQP